MSSHVFVYAGLDDEVEVVFTALHEYQINIGGTRLHLPPPVADRLYTALSAARPPTADEE